MPFSNRILLLFLLVLSGNGLKAYNLKPVIIQLYHNDQPDTVGFNLVDGLPDFFYSQFENGRLTLYDSPAKKIKITFDALKQIEHSNKSKAAKIKTLFIHELWSLKKHQLSFFPMGVTLSDFDEKGNVISYGYVDLEEAYPLLISNFIKTNANGPAYLSYWDALKSRRFYYHLIQFGKQSFQDKAMAEYVKEKNLYKGYRTSTPETFAKNKLITYQVWGTNEQLQSNEILLKKLDDVLRNHPVLYDSCNLVKDNAGMFPSVTGIQVKEIWSEKGGFFDYKPVSLTIFFSNNKTCELLFGNVPFTDFKIFENDITSKLFNLKITYINAQQIKPAESAEYIYAMRSSEISWTQLTTFVKQKQK